MGVVWSHSIKCNRFLMDKLIDNETWFEATLIEYNSLSSQGKDEWNLSLRRSYNRKSTNINSLRRIFKKRTKCYGRICVHENCIVFQGLNCQDLLKAIICHQDRSLASMDTSLASSPSSLTKESPNLPSYAPNPSYDDIEQSDMDRLNTFVWPMYTVRHFGYKNKYFSFDSGRFSPTGEGRFTFKLKNASAFLAIFQNRYCQHNQTSQDTYSPLSNVSPYYNDTTSCSYRNISQITPAHMPDDNQYRTKSLSKSIEFTFNNKSENQGIDDSAFPINYSKIDFSNGYANAESMSEIRSNVRHTVFDFKKGFRDSIYYLTISENQTKAAEEVLKRIGSKKK